MPEVKIEPRFLIFGLLAIVLVIAFFKFLPALTSSDSMGGEESEALLTAEAEAQPVASSEPAPRQEPPEVKVEGDLVGRVISAEEAAAEAEQG